MGYGSRSFTFVWWIYWGGICLSLCSHLWGTFPFEAHRCCCYSVGTDSTRPLPAYILWCLLGVLGEGSCPTLAVKRCPMILKGALPIDSFFSKIYLSLPRLDYLLPFCSWCVLPPCSCNSQAVSFLSVPLSPFLSAPRTNFWRPSWLPYRHAWWCIANWFCSSLILRLIFLGESN